MDLSSASGVSQPGVLTSLATNAASASMNVFGYKDANSDATTTTGHGGSQASSIPIRRLLPVDLSDTACASQGAAQPTVLSNTACASQGAVQPTVLPNPACASQGAAQPTVLPDSACASQGAAQPTASPDPACASQGASQLIMLSNTAFASKGASQPTVLPDPACESQCAAQLTATQTSAPTLTNIQGQPNVSSQTPAPTPIDGASPSQGGSQPQQQPGGE